MSAARGRKLLALGMMMLLMSGVGLAADSSAPAAGADATSPDTVAPDPVAGLVAVDGRDGKVKLSWNVSADGDFAHYVIYYGNDFFLTVMNRTVLVKLADIATGNFTASGLSDGVQYFFAVTAVDRSGNENRTVVSVPATPTSSVVPDTTAPPSITGLSASDARDGKVNLSWAPVNCSDFNHYSIYVATEAGAPVSDLSATLKLADMATARITLTGLKDGTTYYFAVTAVDRSGNENRTARATVLATPTARAPATDIGAGDNEGPKEVDLALYRLITGLLLVAFAALATFKVLSVAHRPPEIDRENPGDGNAVGERAPKEEGEDGNEEE